MVVLIHIGFRHCEKKTISVISDYTIKAQQLNPTTIIYVLNVDLLDEDKSKNYLCLRLFVFISEACSILFRDFLEKFIQIILIIDSVLSFIGAFELIVFQNKMDQFYFPKHKQTALDMVRDFMIFKSITAIKQDDFFSITPFSTMNPISQCIDTRRKNIVSHEI